MPVVNIGTVKKSIHAFSESLSKSGFDFSRAISFMSGTTNDMKEARSEVQKLIRMKIQLFMMQGVSVT